MVLKLNTTKYKVHNYKVFTHLNHNMLKIQHKIQKKTQRNKMKELRLHIPVSILLIIQAITCLYEKSTTKMR